MRSLVPVFLFLLILALIPMPAYSRGLPVGATSLTKVTNGKEKHFDRDRDGFLSPYERLSLQTHLNRGYPLVRKNTQKPYDFDRDLMLAPFEMSQYLADKKSGRLGETYAKYKADLKKQERSLEGRSEKVRRAMGL